MGWQPPVPFTPVHSHRLLHIQPKRSAGKHLLGCQNITAQQININWWQLQIILIVHDKSSQMVSSPLIQTWSCAIIPALVTATSITKVGQTTQPNTHSSNLILISSHIQVRHRKSHQMKQLSMCCHLNNLCTVSQNSSTQQDNKKLNMRWLRTQAGVHPKPQMFVSNLGCLCPVTQH